jgi:pyruvate/2-oxoglutarate dehydrogenase complex dihydrolipoamide dehydrogenase (E3) component
MEGYLVGKRAVILGSGDIGLIMARRLSLEGAKVLACVELMPYSNGLNRNVVQCLHDFDIPLYLSHTITRITGSPRVESVTISKVDEKRNPIPGTEITFDCDTVLLSVGLIPENEVAKSAGIALDSRTKGPIVYENMETSIEGIFAAGNTVHVHDLVDYVTAESQRAGRCAAEYVKGGRQSQGELPVTTGNAVNYTVPQKIHLPAQKPVEIFFRVATPMENKAIVVTALETGEELLRLKRLHLAPGEMEKISVPVEALQKASSGIKVSIE